MSPMAATTIADDRRRSFTSSPRVGRFARIAFWRPRSYVFARTPKQRRQTVQPHEMDADKPTTADINSCITEKYKCMLSAFKFLDLQRILLAFDHSIIGEQSELLMRAIDLISYPPNDFDCDDYLSVIGETYLMKFTLTPGGTIPSQTSNILKCVHSEMYEVIDVILAPFVLNGINNVKYGLTTIQKTIQLSSEQCNDIVINKDDEKDEYIYQVHIRASQSTLELEKSDCLPRICFIVTNNNICPLLPQMSIEDGTDDIGRRLLKPIDCTRFLMLDPSEENKIKITWKSDGASYIIGMYLVKKPSINSLLMKLLKHRSQQSVDASRSDIIKRISNLKSDLERVSSNRVSLVCPLSKTKIKIPVKSLYCDHLQCFDARMYISTNDKYPLWKCPVCNKCCFYDDLRIDFYVLEIIIKINIINRRTRREILNDGALKVYFANTNEVAIIVGDIPTENPINFTSLDKCYDDKDPASFQRKYEKNEKDNLKPTVDNVISHNEKNLSEDEVVQVVKNTQPESIIDLTSQFEIQSESVTNSSIRCVGIELDSTTQIIDLTSDYKNDEQDCEVHPIEVTQSECTN